MKKTFYALLMALACSNLPLLAETYDFTESSDTTLNYTVEAPNLNATATPGPFTFETYYDYIGKSKFEKRRFKKQKIWFSDYEADLSMLFYYNPEVKEAANIELGYNSTDIHWSQNPYFSQTRFQTGSISLGAITKRMCKWLWKAKISLNMDLDRFDFSEYATWDALAWGRYDYCENVGIHMGFIIMTGMKIDHFYPIVGFDWKLNDCWKINAVFPVNASIVYSINDFWSVELAARGWEVRYRTGKKQPLSKAVLEYRNTGIELGVNYDWNQIVHVDIHAGYTLGGKLKIANKDNHHNHHLSFEAAPYAGAEFEVHF